MEKLEVLAAYDQKLIKEIPLIGKEEAEKQLDRAYTLFQDSSRWLKAHQRKAILDKTAQLMEGRIEELTKIAAQEG